MNRSISFFAPAFNEESNIEDFIKNVDEVLKRITPDYEITIVNDGSVDRTKIIIDSLKEKNKNLNLINHKKNKGYGEALKSGFRNAKKELVVFTDSDLQLDIKEIYNFLKYIDSYPIVIGYRINRQDNIIRKLNGSLWNFLIRIVLGIKFRDVDCAFKMFKRKVIEDITFKSSGALISAELLKKIEKKGYKIKEIPVNHYPRKSGKQTGNSIRVIGRAFKELLILGREIKRE